AIEQKTGSKNTRSTVGTTTEVYDYLRLLFARVGKTICFNCGKEVKKDTTKTVAEFLGSLEEGTKCYLAFPLSAHEGRNVKEEIDLIKKRGFFRIYYKNELHDLNETAVNPKSKKDVRVVVERLKITHANLREKLADSIETTFKEGEDRLVIINAETNEQTEFNKFYECCGIRYEEPEPRFFSFNNPFGACPVCQGFSKVIGVDMNLVVPNPNLTLLEGAIAPWRTPKFSQYFRELVQNAKVYEIPLTVPFKDLPPHIVNVIRKGTKEFTGIDEFFEKLEGKTYKMHIRILLSKYRGYTTCHACKGSRLRREALQVKIHDHSIYDLVKLSIEKSLTYFNELKLSEYETQIAERILKELQRRLSFLNDVGLSYLTLDRLSSTLSGGETQRINLATALGSALVGTLYVLDEPSIGLHPRDNEKLIRILKNLRDIGNSVLVVEHDEEMIRTADVIVDMGPKAGQHGGEIIAQGTAEEIIQNENSITGKYLSGKLSIPLPKKRKSGKTSSLKIIGAREHNLKNIDVEIPRNSLTVITGLSGSGKSSLAFDTIYAEGQRRYIECLSAYARQFLDMLEKPDVDSIEGLSPAISIEQKSASGNPRSTVGTVTEIYDYLRLLYARVGVAHCYNCGKPVTKQTSTQIIETILNDLKGKKILILAPVIRG
ncbi:MAG: excinuclease ABC subunit A, partial [Ignavibacteria bacterium]|nr:excinuclease ABC subunit A [Ignavibacteria bacterium]